MAQIEEIAQRGGLGILEDACEAIGAVDSEGRRVGTRGNAAAFAFYPNKQMTTGEGGMLIPPGAEAAARYRSERNQGRAADMEVLEHERLGFNYRLSELACALGIGQIERIEELLQMRADVADAYEERLTELTADQEGAVKMASGPGRRARRRATQLVSLRDPASCRRRPRRGDLRPRRRRNPVQGLSPLPAPVPASARARVPRGQFPVAERASARSLALPFFSSMREGEVGSGLRALLAGALDRPDRALFDQRAIIRRHAEAPKRPPTRASGG